MFNNQCSFPSEGALQWRDEYHQPFVYKQLIATISINGITLPFTVTLNFLLILCILLKKRLRRKKSFVIMTYLAITDFAVGMVLQPIFLARQLCQLSGNCTNLCVMDNVFAYLNAICGASSVLHLVLVAWERYVAVKHALRYKVIVTDNKLFAGTVAAWLISLTFGCRVFLVQTLFIYRTVIFLPLLIGSLSIFYFYTVILLESRRHRRQIKANTPHETQTENLSRKKEFHGATTTAIVFACLLTSYGPIVIIYFVYSAVVKTGSWSATSFCITSWAQILLMLNSLCNPLIYSWRLKRVRQSFKSIFKCCPQDINEQNVERTRPISVINVEPSRNRLDSGTATNRKTALGPKSGVMNAC